MLKFSTNNQRIGLVSPRGLCAPDNISDHGNKEFESTYSNLTTPVSIPLDFKSFVPDNQPSIYSSEQSGDFALRGTKKVNMASLDQKFGANKLQENITNVNIDKFVNRKDVSLKHLSDNILINKKREIINSMVDLKEAYEKGKTMLENIDKIFSDRKLNTIRKYDNILNQSLRPHDEPGLISNINIDDDIVIGCKKDSLDKKFYDKPCINNFKNQTNLHTKTSSIKTVKDSEKCALTTDVIRCIIEDVNKMNMRERTRQYNDMLNIMMKQNNFMSEQNKENHEFMRNVLNKISEQNSTKHEYKTNNSSCRQSVLDALRSDPPKLFEFDNKHSLAELLLDNFEDYLSDYAWTNIEIRKAIGKIFLDKPNATKTCYEIIDDTDLDLTEENNRYKLYRKLVREFQPYFKITHKRQSYKETIFDVFLRIKKYVEFENDKKSQQMNLENTIEILESDKLNILEKEQRHKLKWKLRKKNLDTLLENPLLLEKVLKKLAEFFKFYNREQTIVKVKNIHKTSTSENIDYSRTQKTGYDEGTIGRRDGNVRENDIVRQNSQKCLNYVNNISNNSVLTCYKCKQPGHKRTSCPRISCYKCGEHGHTQRNCLYKTTIQEDHFDYGGRSLTSKEISNNKVCYSPFSRFKVEKTSNFDNIRNIYPNNVNDYTLSHWERPSNI